MKAKLILASGSPRRRELLEKARIPHQVAVLNTPEISPDQPHGMTPAEFAWRNALRKARAAAEQYPGQRILAADTVVALGTHILGKPKHQRQAASFLKKLSGRTHEVLTAVIVLLPKSVRPYGFVERTEVTFRSLSAARIARYLKAVHVLDKAGAYALQEKGAEIVKTIRGSRTNVVGLPIERLTQLLHGLR
ncbi:MAG: septum formation protein Maf [Verrucomicrobia bacterium Tous-C9LFEB]|nr:MAG: septum formation protein Maf [Verrucomicrobia bacterium Tous-C9LFEB]